MFKLWATQITENLLFSRVKEDLCGRNRGKLEGKTYHHLVKGHPTVRREVLQHGHQELQTAIPVAQQQHHPNQIDNAHHRTGQVIGHVKDLSVKIRAHYI